MSYNDRESSNYGAMGGVGGVILLVLMVGLRVGLKAAARSARNHNYSESQYDNSPQYANLPETNREAARVTSLNGSSSNISNDQQQTANAQQQSANAQQQADAQAAYNARVQQEATQREADRVQREQAERVQREQAEANQRAQAEQQEANAQAQRDRELADQQAREEALRNQEANANNPPAAIGPAAAPEQAPAAPVDQTPGFAITDLAQVRPRDSVLVSVNGQWLPALVQAKRGQQIQVRDKATGNVEVVALEKIRLEKEPIAKAAVGKPNALRAVGTGPAPKANVDDDDSLYVAKPKKEGDPSAPVEPGAPAVAATKPGAVNPGTPAAGEFRTWTNDTGAFKVEASLVSFEFGQVQLRKRDGKVLSLSLDKLSPADQAVVRDRFK